MRVSAVIPSAGSGSRYSKNKNKLLEDLGSVPVIIHTLKAVSNVEEINEIIICTSQDLLQDIKDLVDEYKIQKVSKIILGGATRQESVGIGVKNCAECDFVLIHDGARPLIDVETIKKSIETAKEKGATIVAVPTKDTIKSADTNLDVVATLNRSELWNVQTPQVFRYCDILNAHEQFKNESLTDDSALIEKMGIKVAITQGSYKNIKITTQEDLEIAMILMNKKEA